MGPITVGVGAVIWNDRREILLIRRMNPPLAGEWSLPGGRVESGERLHAALKREVAEETGLEIEILGLIDVVDLLPDRASDHPHYVLIDYAARAVSGAAVAASDAAEAAWVPFDKLDAYPLWSETRRVIRASERFIDRPVLG